MQLFRVFATCLIATVPLIAQSPTLVHIDVNSADPDAAIAFWKGIIGTSTYSSESHNGVSMMGARILFTRNAPSGGSVGSAIDLLGLHVPDLEPFIAKLAKTRFKSFQPTAGGDVLIIDGPDDVRIELTADSSMYAPLEFGYIHFSTTHPKDTQAWYAKHFGAKPNTEDPLDSSRLVGGTLKFGPANSELPTAGRAIDHLSFEVKDLPSFCKTLGDDGVKLDPLVGGASNVFLTDPWGTRIELIQAAAR